MSFEAFQTNRNCNVTGSPLFCALRDICLVHLSNLYSYLYALLFTENKIVYRKFIPFETKLAIDRNELDRFQLEWFGKKLKDRPGSLPSRRSFYACLVCNDSTEWLS